MAETEILDYEYPLKREDLIRKYEDDKIRRDSFLDWIDGDGIYLLLGDAGTGKTTYVHYLKWKYTSIDWKILAIKRATERINLIGRKIKSQNFYSLHGKVIACILDKLLSIIVDNIERFIGVHEIFSNELVKFIKYLRRIVDNYKNDFFLKEENRNLFTKNFQFIVSMRNTSARGFTPKQNADFFEGSVDLSEWFSIGEIIRHKIEWYEKNGYTIENADRFQYIMDDFGITDEGIVRGLRPKLNLIFNFNKRLTVQTFEFISCMENISIPMLCTLPKEKDLLNIEICKLPCIQIIEKVFEQVYFYK